MTETAERAAQATALNDAALDQVVGGGAHTGGRFQLDIGNYSVGYDRPAPPPPPPPTKP